VTGCPWCEHENPDGAKFCMECGTVIDAGRPVAQARKVVTTLFCDLVGFTALTERSDPEDVDHLLAAYFARVRDQIESYGGVVEKYIGDAVVGVFGAPVAHEDDPERAVRAALDALTEKERTVLLMREEGFAHREIAEAVGTTTGSVGTMIARALDKLAERLPLDPEDTP